MITDTDIRAKAFELLEAQPAGTSNTAADMVALRIKAARMLEAERTLRVFTGYVEKQVAVVDEAREAVVEIEQAGEAGSQQWNNRVADLRYTEGKLAGLTIAQEEIRAISQGF